MPTGTSSLPHNDSFTFQRDIALLELEKDVRQTSDVVPAPVKKRSQGPINEYNLCHTKGWGRTGESADFSSTLKTVYLKLLTK